MPAHPSNADAFVQVNVVEGEGYLDVRGALVRQFSSQFNSWVETNENGSTLHFTDPSDPGQSVQELKIGHQNIWLHFGELASDVAIRQQSSTIVDEACALMQVTHLSRQGLRVYKVFPSPSVQEAVASVRRRIVPDAVGWQLLGEVSTAATTVQVVAGRLKASIQVRPVQRVTAQLTVSGSGASPLPQKLLENDPPPPFGILLDVDLFDDIRSESRDPKPHLNRALRFLSEKLVPHIAALLEDPA